VAIVNLIADLLAALVDPREVPERRRKRSPAVGYEHEEVPALVDAPLVEHA
jgi:hypothetical protein